jgi:hypothetical protein
MEEEMKRMLLTITCAVALAAAAPAAFAKGGGDDPAGHNQGKDGAAQVKGNDDPAGHDAGDDNGGTGAAAKGSDDPAGHDAGDDNGRQRGRNLQARSKAARGSAAGACTGRSTSKLKANPPRNGRIQVEFEVESHVSGQVWTVKMDDKGATFFKGNKTTLAPGGSFEAKASAKDQAGKDAITATANNAATGETCTASVSV